MNDYDYGYNEGLDAAAKWCEEAACAWSKANDAVNLPVLEFHASCAEFIADKIRELKT